MHTRRQFVVRAPLGLLGAVAACRGGTESAASPATNAAAAAGPAASPPALTPQSSSTGPVLRWVPKHEELVYTFGGAKPLQRIQPGTRIITWTEDCFDGTVKTSADLPSKVMPPGHDNPQTGPFFVEGAEPGDTLAIHIITLYPARTWAVSSFSPGFGALVGTDQTAMLGPTFPNRRGATR